MTNNSALINLVTGSIRLLFVLKTAALNYLLNSKQDTDKVGVCLVKKMEPLAAKEPDIFLRVWWRPNKG